MRSLTEPTIEDAVRHISVGLPIAPAARLHQSDYEETALPLPIC